MEPDIKEFLVRILNTISMALIWLLVNMCLGIYFDFGFFDNSPKWFNYIYYIWFIASLTWLIFYFKRKWKGWKELGES